MHSLSLSIPTMDIFCVQHFCAQEVIVLKAEHISPGQWLCNATSKCHHLSGLRSSAPAPSHVPHAAQGLEFLGQSLLCQVIPAASWAKLPCSRVCRGCGIPPKGIPGFNGKLCSWIVTLWCCHASLIQSIWKESVSPLLLYHAERITNINICS